MMGILLSALISVSAPRVAFSAPCATQLRFLRSALKETIQTDRDWATKWSLGWASLAAVQLGASAFVTSQDKRKDLYVGAVGSAAGLLPTFIVRPRSLSYEDLAARTDDSCDSLAATEAALESTAADERLRHGWLARAGGVLFSTGLGLFLGLNYHHWVPAGVTIGFGLVATELMIRTGSDHASESLRRYHDGDLTSRSSGGGWPRVTLMLNPKAVGLGFLLPF